MGYPTLRSAEELEDTSLVIHLHSTITTIGVRELWTVPMFQVCLSLMAVLETTSGHLQQGILMTASSIPMPTAPVPPLILVQLHLLLWEETGFASLGTLDNLKPSGTSTTLCGTHRGVRVGALAVIVVVHGSLPH